MANSLMKKYITWFNTYVESFINKYPDLSENIKLKAGHSHKVHSEIIGLANALNLSENEKFIAELIGLFHDVGRFNQFIKYRTFSDSELQNHADLGIEALKENSVLKDLKPKEQEIIYKAIYNHSRAEIDEDKNEKVIFFSKMIRDADKLDIWRLITEYYMVREQKTNKTLELDLPDSYDVTPDVLNAIVNQKVVLKKSLKTLSDFKLLQIGWLFDLNFEYSIQRVYDKEYLDKIFDTLPETDKINQIKEIVDAYFDKHIKTLPI